MAKVFTIFTFLSASFIFTNSCSGQIQNVSTKMNFGKGVHFTSSDSLFTLAINGRIQSLFEARTDINTGTSGADFILRRCRLNIQGNAFDPRFSYRIQIGFAHGDITSGNSLIQNNLVLRDAILFYKANKWLRFGFGQTKLPGNRQRIVSSANLQLVERSIANNNFTLDRDKGLWVFTNFGDKSAVMRTTFAISSGEGRILSDRNGKLCYSARVEFLPMGDFSKHGDIMESDQEREPKPKLSIAGVYSYNDQTSRTMGQLGDYLYNDQASSILYYGGDLMFKYNGFSLEAETYRRKSDRGIVINVENANQQNAVVAGTSFMVQSGYFITKKKEVAVRYAQIIPDKNVSLIIKKQLEYTIGGSHYFSKHNLKIQSDISYFKNGINENLVYRLSTVLTF